MVSWSRDKQRVFLKKISRKEEAGKGTLVVYSCSNVSENRSLFRRVVPLYSCKRTLMKNFSVLLFNKYINKSGSKQLNGNKG